MNAVVAAALSRMPSRGLPSPLSTPSVTDGRYAGRRRSSASASTTGGTRRKSARPLPKRPSLQQIQYRPQLSQGLHRSCRSRSRRNSTTSVELVIVMGRTAKNVSEADALSYVAGYLHGQRLHRPRPPEQDGRPVDARQDAGPVRPARALPRHCRPGRPRQAEGRLRVNGELRQSSNTSDMIFNTRKIISFISR